MVMGAGCKSISYAVLFGQKYDISSRHKRVTFMFGHTFDVTEFQGHSMNEEQQRYVK